MKGGDNLTKRHNWIRSFFFVVVIKVRLQTTQLNSFFFVVVKVRLQTTQLNWNLVFHNHVFFQGFVTISVEFSDLGKIMATFRIFWFFWHKIQFRPPNFSLLGSNLYSTWPLEFYFHLGFKKPGINLSKTHFFQQI